MNKKKILILGGASIHIKVVEAAKEMGIYTIVTDYLENSPAKAMADESWMIDVTDVDEVAKKCKETGVDGVLNVCVDPCQIPYYKICEKLGLPCYGTAEQFFIMTNKPAFKQFCVENGVDIIPDYTEEDVTDGNISYPVLIKPAVSRGSRGQTICYDDSNIEEAILFAKNESSDKNIVIEKYMGDCQDFSMTYMIVDGEAKLIRTGDRYLGSKYSDHQLHRTDGEVRDIPVFLPLSELHQAS